MGRVWLELKYGQSRAGITIYRLEGTQVLQAFKRKALNQARWNAQESEVIDPVIGLMDRFDLEKLQAILELLIPANEISIERL